MKQELKLLTNAINLNGLTTIMSKSKELMLETAINIFNASSKSSYIDDQLNEIPNIKINYFYAGDKTDTSREDITYNQYATETDLWVMVRDKIEETDYIIIDFRGLYDTLQGDGTVRFRTSICRAIREICKRLYQISLIMDTKVIILNLIEDAPYYNPVDNGIIRAINILNPSETLRGGSAILFYSSNVIRVEKEEDDKTLVLSIGKYDRGSCDLICHIK